MTKTKEADYVLITSVAVLLLFGLMMLSSASAAVGHERFGDSYFFIKRQLLYGVLPGIAAFFFFAKLPYAQLKRMSPWLYVASLILLLLVFIPGIGSSLGTGAQSWILLGGFSFQPAEVAKLGLLLFFAWYLARLGPRLSHLANGFIPALLYGFLPVALVILQPDIGTVSLLFGMVFGMLFLARAKLRHLLILAVAGVVVLGLMVLLAPYRAARLTTFLHPELDPQGIGYHINQAFLAVGSGGWFGLGFGHSRQKFQYLPEVHADSIFAVIAEEMGFVFALGAVALIACIAWRGLSIARRAPDDYGRLLAGGAVLFLFLQSLINIGAMVGLMPLTGLPLPLVSHGGTALIVALSAVGLLVNVSKQRT